MGLEVRPEDVERVWPLGFRHVNMLGRYSFNLSESLAHGDLRPLRDPSDPADQEPVLAEAFKQHVQESLLGATAQQASPELAQQRGIKVRIFDAQPPAGTSNPGEPGPLQPLDDPRACRQTARR